MLAHKLSSTHLTGRTHNMCSSIVLTGDAAPQGAGSVHREQQQAFRQLECELQAEFCLCPDEKSYSSSLIMQLSEVGILEVQQFWSTGRALPAEGGMQRRLLSSCLLILSWSACALKAS